MFKVEVYKWRNPTCYDVIKEKWSFDTIQYDIQTPSYEGYGVKAFPKVMRFLFSNPRLYYGHDSEDVKCSSKLERETREILANEMGEDGEKMLVSSHPRDLYQW